MYNYNLENATVIFCTDKPRSLFDSELSSGKFYDQLLDVSHGNCSLPTASNATCVPTPTCVAPELNIAPVPYGVMWEYEIEGTNSTNFTTPCGVKFTKMDMTYEACTKAHVHVYRYSAGSGAYLVFMISIIYVIVRFGLELAGVIAFHKKCCTSCGKEGKDSVLFGIAAGGLFGPLYSFGELIAKRDVNMITEAADLPLPVEVVLLFFPDTYNPAQSTMSSPLSPHNQYQPQQHQQYQQQQNQPQQQYQQQQWSPPQNQYPQSPHIQHVQAQFEL